MKTINITTAVQFPMADSGVSPDPTLLEERKEVERAIAQTGSIIPLEENRRIVMGDSFSHGSLGYIREASWTYRGWNFFHTSCWGSVVQTCAPNGDKFYLYSACGADPAWLCQLSTGAIVIFGKDIEDSFLVNPTRRDLRRPW